MNGRMDGFVPPKLDLNVQSGVLPDDKLCIDFNQALKSITKQSTKDKGMQLGTDLSSQENTVSVDKFFRQQYNM